MRYKKSKFFNVILLILSLSLLWQGILYACPASIGSLRAPVGEKDTYKCIKKLVAVACKARNKKVDKETALPHHFNRQNVEFILPKERFGAKVNIINVLKNSLKAKLGKVPLISIFGSLSYARDEKDEIIWDFIGDFDITVYVDKQLSGEEDLEIRRYFFGSLKKSGIKVFTPGFDSFFGYVPMESWGIVDSAGKIYRLHLFNLETKELFPKKNPSRDSITDLFFGDTETIDKALSVFGPEAIAEEMALFCEEIMEEVRKSASHYYVLDCMPYQFSRLLKSLYRVAYIQGKEAQFGWLLENYRQLSVKYDEKLFRDSYERAFKQLDIGKEPLRAELRRQILRNVFFNNRKKRNFQLNKNKALVLPKGMMGEKLESCKNLSTSL